MIDTVVLKISKEQVSFSDIPTIVCGNWELQSKTRNYDKYIKNSMKNESEYFPRLTLYKRGNREDYNTSIKIEFSVPKLLYHNNLDEVSDRDFPEVLRVLRKKLDEMGLIVSIETLKNAQITTVHYSKNIKIESGYTANYIINELNKINASKSFDITRAKYVNDGQSFTCHNQSHAFIVYDKVADLAKTSKKAIDKDQSLFQMSLFDQLPKKTEILRLEIRIIKIPKLNQLLKKLNFKENPSFEQVFSEKLSQKIVWHYWETIIKLNAPLLFCHALQNKEILAMLLQNVAKLKQSIYLAGLFILAKENNGLRELRSIAKASNQRSLYRMMADYKDMQKYLIKLNPRDWFFEIDRQLQKYNTIKINQFE